MSRTDKWLITVTIITSVIAIGVASAALARGMQPGPQGPRGVQGIQGVQGKQASATQLRYGVCWEQFTQTSTDGSTSWVTSVAISSPQLVSGVYQCGQGMTFVSIVPLVNPPATGQAYTSSVVRRHAPSVAFRLWRHVVRQPGTLGLTVTSASCIKDVQAFAFSDDVTDGVASSVVHTAGHMFTLYLPFDGNATGGWTLQAISVTPCGAAHQHAVITWDSPGAQFSVR